MSEIATTETPSTTAPVIGLVKWFNSKSGYGFITATIDGVSKDVFVHHSAIQITASQYKYLVQGEYVQFAIEELTGSSHEIQAVRVCGINGGPLQCETRRQRVERRGPSATTGKVAAV